MKIVWSELAVAHLRSAYDYIAAENVPAAHSTIERILRATEHLGDHPNLGRSGRVSQTRELIISGTPLIVVYRIRAGELTVLGVFHAARKWPAEF
jgi:toxin ParE1/3/4